MPESGCVSPTAFEGKSALNSSYSAPHKGNNNELTKDKHTEKKRDKEGERERERETPPCF